MGLFKVSYGRGRGLCASSLFELCYLCPILRKPGKVIHYFERLKNIFRSSDLFDSPILAQCSIFIPPENVRKPSGGIKMEHWLKID